ELQKSLDQSIKTCWPYPTGLAAVVDERTESVRGSDNVGKGTPGRRLKSWSPLHLGRRPAWIGPFQEDTPRAARYRSDPEGRRCDGAGRQSLAHAEEVVLRRQRDAESGVRRSRHSCPNSSPRPEKVRFRLHKIMHANQGVP